MWLEEDGVREIGGQEDLKEVYGEINLESLFGEVQMNSSRRFIDWILNESSEISYINSFEENFGGNTIMESLKHFIGYISSVVILKILHSADSSQLDRHDCSMTGVRFITRGKAESMRERKWKAMNIQFKLFHKRLLHGL